MTIKSRPFQRSELLLYFLQFLQKTIIYLYSIHELISVTKTHPVFCNLRTGSVYIMWNHFSMQMVKELNLTHRKFAWGASSRELHYCPVSQHNFVVPLEVLKKRVDGEFKHTAIMFIRSRFSRRQLSWLLYFQFHISFFFASSTATHTFALFLLFLLPISFSYLISKSV